MTKGKGKDKGKGSGKTPAGKDTHYGKAHKDKNSNNNGPYPRPRRVRHGEHLIPQYDEGGWFMNPASGWRQSLRITMLFVQ